MANFKSHRPAAERVFDHLYDPVYATSGHRDVQRNNYRSMAASARVGVYPVFQTMFTDLPWRRRNLYVPQSNMLPNIHRMANSSLPECPIVQSTYAKPAVLVSGADRAMFFNKPLKNTNTIALRLNLLDIDCCCIPVPLCSVRPQAVGCQSEFRIQSAQTNPWMPDAVIRNANGTQEPAETPEVVYVADLLREDRINCMPGVYEAELVTRARKRRTWERSLPPIATQKDFEGRRTVLEAFEWEAWIGRENRIEYCQRLRLGIVQRLMKERQEKHKFDCVARTESSKQRLEAERDTKLQKLRSEHRRRQRRLDAVHNGVPMKWRACDVITEHIDPSSVLYAPPMRFGKHPKQRHFASSTTFNASSIDAVNLVEDNVVKLPAKGSRKTANEELQELYIILQSLRARRAKIVQSNCFQNVKEITSSTFATNTESKENRKQARQRQMRMAALLGAESQIQEVADQAASTTISFALDLLDSENYSTEKIDEARRKRLQTLIGDAVITPRGVEMPSHRAGMDAVTDDPTYLEAMKCIERVLERFTKGGGSRDTERSQEGSILDEIINSANLYEVDSVAMSSRSVEHERLTEIVTDVNKKLWAYANEANESEARDINELGDQFDERTNDLVDGDDKGNDFDESEDNYEKNADVDPIMNVKSG